MQTLMGAAVGHDQHVHSVHTESASAFGAPPSSDDGALGTLGNDPDGAKRDDAEEEGHEDDHDHQGDGPHADVPHQGDDD
jgi:hypothetical protein